MEKQHTPLLRTVMGADYDKFFCTSEEAEIIRDEKMRDYALDEKI
jgi:hypothetical protein